MEREFCESASSELNVIIITTTLYLLKVVLHCKLTFMKLYHHMSCPLPHSSILIIVLLLTGLLPFAFISKALCGSLLLFSILVWCPNQVQPQHPYHGRRVKSNRRLFGWLMYSRDIVPVTTIVTVKIQEP